MDAHNLCRVCKSEIKDSDLWTFFGYNFGACATCESTQKLITNKQYRDINPTYDPGMYIEDADSIDALRRQLEVDAKKLLLQKYAGKDLADKRFLDIGCGLGGFLIAAKELGMIPSGYEPSTLHYSQLAKLYPNSFDIVNDYFESEKCEGAYDVIMLSHVIEHIYDQKTFISGICSKLNVGGILLMVTPNNQSIEAKLSGKRWIMYKPVDHVSLIGPTAARELTPAGCRIAVLESAEYRGEFAVHMLSALKTALTGPKATGTLESGEKPRKQISAASISPWVKSVLQMVSLPFWLYGKLTNRLACMTVAYQRTS